MKKRIISSILIILLLIMNIAYAQTEQVPIPEWIVEEISTGSGMTEYRYKDTYTLLNYLGVVTENAEEINPLEKATRGYAVTLFAKLETDKLISPAQQDFSDVLMSNEYVDGIHTALQYGIIEKQGDRFYPNNVIAYEDCVEMAISVLGYDIVPNIDTMALADELELFRDITKTEDAMTKGDLFLFIRNMLRAETVELEFSGNNGGYKIIGTEESYLEKYKNIQIITGYVTSTGMSATYGKTSFSKEGIEINKMYYNTLNIISESLLGKSVYAYLDFDSNTIIEVWENSRENTETIIDANNFSEITPSYLIYESDKSRKRISFEDNADLIYNGQYWGKIDKAIESGIFDKADSVRILDNNRNQKGEFVFVEFKEYYVVDSVSAYSSLIRFKMIDEPLDLSDKACEDYKIFNTKGEQIELKDLLNKTVIELRRSQRIDGKNIYEMISSTEKISGTFTAQKTENNITYYTVDGKQYEVSDFYLYYLEENVTDEKPKIGRTSTFYLSADNKIVYSDADIYSYGFVLSSYISEEDEKCMIKMYTMNGNMEVAALEDKVTLFTPDLLSGAKVNANVAFNALHENGETANKVIAYEKNTAGNIKTVVTEYDMVGRDYEEIDYPLIKSHVAGGEGYRTEQNRFYYRFFEKKYYLPAYTETINIPRDKDRYDDIDYFSVGNMSNFSLDYYCVDERITIYNCDKYYTGQFCLIEGGSVAMDELIRPVMISSISEGLDKDDMPVKIVGYISEGQESFANLDKTVIADSSYDYFGVHGGIDELQRGDIVQMKIDSMGNVTMMRILLKADNMGGYRTQGETISKENTFVDTGLLYGKVTDVNTDIGERFLLNVSDSGTDPNHNLNLYMSTETWAYGTNTYTIYDSDAKEKVRNITFNDIETGDSLVAIKRYNMVTDLFIYR